MQNTESEVRSHQLLKKQCRFGGFLEVSTYLYDEGVETTKMLDWGALDL